MKKSELQQIIREEIKNVLTEGLSDNNIRKANVAIRKFENKYPNHKLDIGLNADWITINGKNVINLNRTNQDAIFNSLVGSYSRSKK